MCDYTYSDTERNCLKSKLELMRYHLVAAFCIIILAVYSTGCYGNCLKNGNTKSFSKAKVKLTHIVGPT